MRLVPRTTAPALLGVLMAACLAAPSPSPADTATPVVSPAATEVAPSPTPASTADPVPSDQLGDFSCDLPLVEDASVAVAYIVDVRVGTHAGYDRVVYEFEHGTPELTLARAAPPFSEDGSGFPIEVDGESFLGLTMRGGTKQTDAGTSSYDGPTDFDAAFATLVHLVEGGDFERQSTWYLGLTDESCARVTLLEDPPRVVIDLEH